MKFVLAPDSFKESLSSLDVVDALSEGIQRVFPYAQIQKIPMADGGEGTCEVITNIFGGEFINVDVQGPLGKPIQARFGYIEKSKTAVIEVAEAIGIHLIKPEERDIWSANSFGVGQLLNEALNQGAKKIILGLGGTVTNDGGAGMLSALGVKLLNDGGHVIEPTPKTLSSCASINTSDLNPLWGDIEITLASDVTSPATGVSGASYIFGRQKGASSNDLQHLDTGIAALVQTLELHTDKKINNLAGAGAAGALPIGLFALFKTHMVPGADLILDLINFDDQCTPESIVFTGEGRIDNQTVFGKGPARVAERAKQKGSKVFAFGGSVDNSASDLIPGLLDAIIPINRDIGDLESALKQTRTNLVKASEMTCRILSSFSFESTTLKEKNHD